MRRQKQIILVALVLFSLVISVSIATFNRANQDQINIAVALPLSNAGEVTTKAGKSMLRGVELYIDKVNRNGGIQGKQLKLKVYDDQGKPEIATQVAEEIVNSNAIAVIGHSSSNTALATGKIYQTAGIPAISGSATADAVTENNDWYFRTIFSDSLQGKFIANYLNKVLDFNKISLIHSYDTYGLNLSNTIDTEFQKLGGEVVTKWQLEENQTSVTDAIILQELQNLLNQENSPEAVIFAAHRDQVTNLLQQMKLQNIDLPIFGSDALGDVTLAQNFADLPQEKENPGYFTNGVYATVPLIYDVANDRTQKFRNEFEKVYRTAPGWSAASYYDAIYAIVEAIERTLASNEQELSADTFTGKNLAADRSLLRESLAKINSPQTAVSGGTRTFYFDQTGTAIVPIAVGLFDRANLVSAFTQLNTIPNLKVVRNLEQEITNGNIFQIGNQYLRKTDVVYVGLDVNEVSQLNEVNSSYVIDFYLWFRYQTAATVDNIEFMNYGIDRLDSGEKLTLGNPLQKGVEDEVKFKIYRLKADFHEQFDFHSYPFDQQDLAVRFRHEFLTRDKLIYALDVVGMRDTYTQELSSQWREKVFREITTWIPQQIIFFQNILVNNSTLGYRNFVKANSDLEFSQFNLVINIRRDFLKFSMKNLLPLWFFVAIAYLVLFLPFENISVEALSGLLLAIVFYHLNLLESLADGVGYVVAIDYDFALVYALLCLEILLVTLD
ncbi:MAG: ABC transporter substrate-binding protein, partial [Oscillatoria sp. PMC 1076.18]|nr:ABC transporter substrate-binding protein [Oscillatoria sp. PMC 1076.18]